MYYILKQVDEANEHLTKVVLFIDHGDVTNTVARAGVVSS